MSPKDCVLKNLITNEYNEEQLFEQYKLYVKMADHVSERRDKSNRFYLSLMACIITLVSIVSSLTCGNSFFIILILICSILICWNWYQNIMSYKRLNRAKFDVINHIENELSARGFTIEYDLMKYRGHNNLTNIEKNIPLYFIGLFVIILVWVIVQYVKFLLAL